MSKTQRIRDVLYWASTALVMIGTAILVAVYANWAWIRRKAWAELIMNTIPQFVKYGIILFIEAPLYQKGLTLFMIGLLGFLVYLMSHIDSTGGLP